MLFCDWSIRNGALGKVSLGSSEFKVVPLKEEGESRGHAAAATEVKHLEVIGDLFVCPIPR